MEHVQTLTKKIDGTHEVEGKWNILVAVRIHQACVTVTDFGYFGLCKLSRF